MAFTNAVVEIRVGNLEARVDPGGAPLPRRALDRALNPHLGSATRSDADQEEDGEALVYDPVRDVVLNGAVGKAKRLLRARGYRLRVRDTRWSAPPAGVWSLVPGVALRDYQAEVVELALEAGHGVIDIGTGGGKTLLAAAICARLSLPTLWLVTTRTLLAQSVANVRTALGIEPGVVGDGENRPEPFTVALVQALDEAKVDLDRWKGGTLVFDEGHHAAAASYLAVIRRIAPRYHYYLSAVPVRTGRDQAVLDALAGRSLTGGKYSARFLVEKGFAAPVEARFLPCRLEGDLTEQPFDVLYRRFIAENPARNGLVARAVEEETSRGRSVLVLVDHVRHGNALMGLLGDGAAFVHGGTARSVLRQETALFSDGARRCLVATAGLFQEGVSIDGIHVLVQAGGLKSRVKVLQAIGRGMRKAPGKESCLYLDFRDDDPAGIFREHALERIRVLREEGFEVHVEATPPPREPQEDVAPSWAHVPGTKRFLLVDAEGAVRARAECLEKDLVPEKHCRRCKRAWCEEGGRTTWQEQD